MGYPVILMIEDVHHMNRYRVAAADMVRYFNDDNLPDELKCQLGMLYARGQGESGSYPVRDFMGNKRYIINVSEDTYHQLRGAKRDARGKGQSQSKKDS
jgi:hypothetical protein